MEGQGDAGSGIRIHKEEVQIEVMLMAAENSQELQPHGNERWKVVELLTAGTKVRRKEVLFYGEWS